MSTTYNESTLSENDPLYLGQPLFSETTEISSIITKNVAGDPPNNLLLWQNQFINHHPKAGLNPLADAAAYLFSIIGKLKQLKSYSHLGQLQKELVAEINAFQEAAKIQGYRTEYILVSRYALCATLDDSILNTPWGGQGQWDTYSLLTLFNQDAAQPERFFLILERIIKDPALYIDVMEFMYICLSLGYKGKYRAIDYSNNQLEQITHALYKRIRVQRGDFSKVLSPFLVKIPMPAKINISKIPYWKLFFMTASIIMLLFIGLGYLLEAISTQAYHALGKSILYETYHP
jgi:type VI secretion system protein ImpK